MTPFTTEQEQFWAGDFGDEYAIRNRGEKFLAARLALFSKILQRTGPIQSVLEFGANIGMNLQALKTLLGEVELSAIEINPTAVQELRARDPQIKVYHQSILEFQPDSPRDLVLSAGVLIHINPDVLPQVYEAMYQSSRRYICVAEYYNPSCVEVRYRGHEGKLFKRDFAGDLLDRFPTLRLIDYGFAYRRDPVFPQDDITWFLLERQD